MTDGTIQVKTKTSSASIKHGGLWAFHRGRFYALSFEHADPDIDHVHWFRTLGLPDYGPHFDRVVRGRFVWDWQFNHWLLSFYGAQQLSNQIYRAVLDFFTPTEGDIIEKCLDNRWY